ncbi:MAG: hypothetical protein AABM67_01830 [Acidobacteriota bacterium]
MNTLETLRDVENLRFRVQMNNRLRLECLAAVSKVFREFEEPINDELLSSVIFALPQELISSNGHSKSQQKVAAGMNAADAYQGKGIPPEEPEKPGLPPTKPSLPPQEPERKTPGLPPTKPSLPPQQPERKAPALPPTAPDRQAPALPPTAG